MSMRARSVTVIGGGPGGYVAALRAAAVGLDVRLVERGELGGTCLNVGCVPSKALLHAAELRRSAGEGPTGVGITVGPADLAGLQTWKSGVVDQLRNGVGSLLRGAGVQTIRGTATLAGPGRVAVDADDGREELETDAVILATGSTPNTLPVLPVDGRRILTSDQALDLRELPDHLAIVGAGYIGLELATAFHGLGARVTVVELAERVLTGIHTSAAGTVSRALQEAGVDIRLQTGVEDDDGRSLRVRGADGSVEELEVDRIVVAVGRRPRSDGLGLETVAIRPDAAGFIPVDPWCRTTAEDVYAIGDLTVGPALAHRASAQGELVAEHLAGGSLPFQPAAVPAVVYTAPEIASVGYTIEEATAAGLTAEEHRFPFAGNARALVHGDGGGAAYLVVDPTNDRVLGIHLVGHGVGELIAAGAVALEMGAVLDDLGDTILPHPTLSEVVGEVVEIARGRPLHSAPRAAVTQR